MAEYPTSSRTMHTTFGAPSGALSGSNGAQSGTESRISTLIVPLNGTLILAPLASLGKDPSANRHTGRAPAHHPRRVTTGLRRGRTRARPAPADGADG